MISDQETISNMALGLASEIAESYQLPSLRPLIESSRALANRDELSVAVVGRFKAGKSSFLNHFLGRELLPVGVTPVTAVVSEIGYGEAEGATVHYLDGRTEAVTLDHISAFIAESENPENIKQVSVLWIELPELKSRRALRFVDMPGLESALQHNTEAALRWLPNVGLALVAISVDPPLSQQDIALLKTVYEYTPKVSILLTKVDLINESEREEVINFVRARLSHTFGAAPPIFPYSIRPGYEHLKTQIDQTLLQETLAQFAEHRSAVLGRKVETLLRECLDYLTLALKSAETIGAEREALKQQVIGEKEALDEAKSELRLVVNSAAGGTRAEVAKRLDSHRRELEARLSAELLNQFPAWSRSLGFALESFERWLNDSLTKELIEISARERAELVAPLDRLKHQIFRSLQNFRDRLSEQTYRAFGVPLRTSESEIVIEEPHTPDVYIGKIFDRNWELLSPITPMSLFRPLVRRHFIGDVPYMIEKNLSRLATQWDESIRAAMMQILNEANRRLDELIDTVERLISTSGDDVPKLRADIERVNSCLSGLSAAEVIAKRGTNALPDSY
jgi:GTP-binding protein EngB required for normal cell division